MADIGATADGQFETWLEHGLKEALACGTPSYTSLLSRFGDVYPSVLLATLQRLASTDQIDRDVVEAIQASARRPCPVVEPRTSLTLPVPHPLDFDWRFSDAALERLAAETQTADPTRLICLGAPSLFRHLKREEARRVYLLDANANNYRDGAEPAEGSDRVQLDLLRDELPTLRSRAVVADPPWYPEYLRAFLWAARELCDAAGSRIWFSLPGVGTRPGIERECADLIAWGIGLGLAVVERSRGALPYWTPPFERNALRAEGITCVPAQWRRGDLLVFAVVADNSQTRPAACSLETAEWEEVCMNQVRVRFRVRRHARGLGLQVDPRLSSIVSGNVLPSVSRRYTRRPLAQVWTSGNRVFGCECPAVAFEVARAIVFDASVEERVELYLGRQLHAAERSRVSEAEAQLRRLTEIETMEYGDEWRRV